MEFIIPGLSVLIITCLVFFLLFRSFQHKHQLYLRDATNRALNDMITSMTDSHGIALEELNEELKRARKVPTHDAQALLQDLLGGYGLIKVERLSPIDYLLKSPKG